MVMEFAIQKISVRAVMMHSSERPAMTVMLAQQAMCMTLTAVVLEFSQTAMVMGFVMQKTSVLEVMMRLSEQLVTMETLVPSMMCMMQTVDAQGH
jgi:hypothetical protein